MQHQSATPLVVEKFLGDHPEAVYVDVRTVEEFQQGHVPGSYNVPFLLRARGGMQPNPEFLAVFERRFAKEQELVLGCKSGGRSERACELLTRRGYAHLINMVGGFHGATDMTGSVIEQGWLACGFETATQALPGRAWEELLRT